MTEQELLEGLLLKQEDAFRQLVEQQKNRIYNTALGIVQDAAVAEDITQEVLIEIFESIGRFRGDSKLSTWLYRIAITRSLEYLRQQKRKKRSGIFIRLFQQSGGEPEADVPDFVHPGVVLENKERALLLFKAIDTLPENQKVAFTLNKVEGLPYREIAVVMNISVSAVESLLHRAKLSLQKKLKALTN